MRVYDVCVFVCRCVCVRVYTCVCAHVRGGRILSIVENVELDNALVPVRLHLVFVLTSRCAVEFATVKVMNGNALVPMRLHISFRTDITLCC